MLRAGGNFVPGRNKYTPLHKTSFSSHKSPSFSPSFTPVFKTFQQTPNFQISQQIRCFEVHPFFLNAYKNIKKKVYHKFNNLFLPGQEKVNTSVYHIYNPFLYFDFKKQQYERWKRFKTKFHYHLATEHLMFYKFIRHWLSKKSLRLKKPKRKRRIKIFSSRSPERVQELLPNRKKVLFDPLRRHADYDESLYHIRNLSHKYYKQDNEFDPVNNKKLRYTIAAYTKQPINARITTGLLSLNKKSKTTALIEGYRNFKFHRSSKPAARFRRSHPAIVSAWRALKQQFKRLKKPFYGWTTYLDRQNPDFSPVALRTFGYKCKKAIILYLDKGDIEPLQRIYYGYGGDGEEFTEYLLFSRHDNKYGTASTHPLVLYNGYRREQTLRTTRVRYRGHRYFEEEDVVVFNMKFRRIYTTLKRKYKVRKQRVFFKVIYDPDQKKYYLFRLKFAYRRKRRPLG